MKLLNHLNNKIARKIQKVSDRWAKHFWHHQPFCSSPLKTREHYRQLWETEKSVSYPTIDIIERALGFPAPQDWLHDLALHTQIVIKTSPLCYQHGRILYSVLRNFIAARLPSQQPITIFETGTARGFSAVVMAKALYDAQQAGKIITFDILPHTVAMYWNCIDDHDQMKSRSNLLAAWREDYVAPYILFIEGDSRINLSRISADHIDFAFLDGAHGYDDVLYEFKTVAIKQRKNDIIVFDDYNLRDFAGLVKAVDDGCAQFGYSKQVIDAGKDRHYVIARRLED